MNDVTPPELLALDIREVCRIIGIGRTTVYRLVAERQLKTVKIGRRTLVLYESVRTLLQKAISESET